MSGLGLFNIVTSAVVIFLAILLMGALRRREVLFFFERVKMGGRWMSIGVVVRSGSLGIGMSWPFWSRRGRMGVIIRF
jgi:hypothetical protein